MPVNRKSGLIAAVLGAVLMAGCAQAPLNEPAAPAPQQQPAVAHARSGNYQAAAKHYEQLAARSRGRARARWLLLAAQSWWRTGNINQVKKVVGASRAKLLNQVQQARLAVLKARIDLFDQHPQKALKQAAVPLNNLPRKIQASILAVRGRSLFQVGQPVHAVALLVKREQRLSAPGAILKNHRLIWSNLVQAAHPRSRPGKSAHRNPIVAGWLALGAIGRRAWQKPPRRFAARIKQWQNHYPEHPANGRLISEILTRHRQEVAYPKKIALLLPLSGQYQAAAQAVRDGFLARRFQFSNARQAPTVAIYDTHADPQTAVSAYRQAVRGGAALVVGPLMKTAVAAVARQTPLAPRVLALNYLKKKQKAPKKFFQFGLAPEDEARAVATRLVQNDLMRGVALVPEDGWGRRMLNSFANRFRALGGTLLAFQTFSPDANDFSTPIQRVLGLDASHRRERTLATRIARHLHYAPRRRQDVQFVYLAARADVARLIRPQLRYYHALDLPVYAPAQVYNSGSGPDIDLNGIKFVDMPFALDVKDAAPAMHRTLAKLWPDNFSRNNRLYALGLDAYRLVPLVHNVKRPLTRPVQGVTGLLSIDRQRRIHRGLDWAQIVHGRAKLLGKPIPMPAQSGATAIGPALQSPL